MVRSNKPKADGKYGWEANGIEAVGRERQEVRKVGQELQASAAAFIVRNESAGQVNIGGQLQGSGSQLTLG